MEPESDRVTGALGFRSLGFGALIGLAVLLGSGCSHTLRVVSSEGIPLPGAEVVAQSASLNYAARRTDDTGEVALERYYAQPPQWIFVTCRGYESHYGDYPLDWPHTILLKPLK